MDYQTCRCNLAVDIIVMVNALQTDKRNGYMQKYWKTVWIEDKKGELESIIYKDIHKIMSKAKSTAWFLLGQLLNSCTHFSHTKFSQNKEISKMSIAFSILIWQPKINTKWTLKICFSKKNTVKIFYRNDQFVWE